MVIRVRADNGFGVPAVYDFCEQQGLSYAIGYASNPVLQRATATALADVELYYAFYGRCDPFVQRFEEIRDYQAESRPDARRIVAKVERTPQGSQRRFVVTNLPDHPEAVYRDFYVRRGAVPEQPIGELNGLQADRLSACGFCANSFRLLLHVVAYAIVVLFREATAAIPEVATAAVGTLRQRLWRWRCAALVTGALADLAARVGDVAVPGPVGPRAGGGARLRGPVAGEGVAGIRGIWRIFPGRRPALRQAAQAAAGVEDPRRGAKIGHRAAARGGFSQRPVGIPRLPPIRTDVKDIKVIAIMVKVGDVG